MRAAVVVGALLLVGCPQNAPKTPAPDPLGVTLRLEPKRGSCSTTPQLYGTDCLGAVAVIVRRGTQEIERCKILNVGDRPTNLLNFLLADSADVFPQGALGWADEDGFTVEVRGLHDVDPPDGGVALCPDDNAEGEIDNVDRWLFWGTSKTVTLPDEGGVVEVAVPVDCRDCSGGCATLGEDNDAGTVLCPSTFPEAYCVPSDPATRTCNRGCDVDEQCFEGSFRCEGTICDPTTNVDGGPRSGFCAPCDADDDCDVGLGCVGLPGNLFCAPLCPINVCVAGATCTRLYNDLFPAGG